MRFIHIVVCSCNLFILIGQVYHNIFTHSIIYRHLGSFYFEAIIDSAVVIFLYVSLGAHIFFPTGCILRSRVAGSQGKPKLSCSGYC